MVLRKIYWARNIYIYIGAHHEKRCAPRSKQIKHKNWRVICMPLFFVSLSLSYLVCWSKEIDIKICKVSVRVWCNAKISHIQWTKWIGPWLSFLWPYLSFKLSMTFCVFSFQVFRFFIKYFSKLAKNERSERHHHTLCNHVDIYFVRKISFSFVRFGVVGAPPDWNVAYLRIFGGSKRYVYDTLGRKEKKTAIRSNFWKSFFLWFISWTNKRTRYSALLLREPCWNWDYRQTYHA